MCPPKIYVETLISILMSFGNRDTTEFVADLTVSVSIENNNEIGNW